MKNHDSCAFQVAIKHLSTLFQLFNRQEASEFQSNLGVPQLQGESNLIQMNRKWIKDDQRIKLRNFRNNVTSNAHLKKN